MINMPLIIRSISLRLMIAFVGSILPFRLALGRQSICTGPATMCAATSVPASYERLSEMLREINNVSSVLGLLSWDEQVMMPAGSAELRGSQKAALTSVIHARKTSDELNKAITAAESDLEKLDAYQKATVRDAARSFQREVLVSADLEREIATHEVVAMQKWSSARSNDDFGSFAPALEKSLDLARRKAKAQLPNVDPYDAMVDTFERGMTADRLHEIFESIKGPLKNILTRTLEAKKACKREVHAALQPSDEWDVGKQRDLCNDLCKALGFDFDKGRIGKFEYHCNKHM